MEVVARFGTALVLVIFIIVFTLALSLCCVILIVCTSGLPYMVTVFDGLPGACKADRLGRRGEQVGDFPLLTAQFLGGKF